MFAQGMILVVLVVWLFICYIDVTKYGVFCTEDFGKPITDPCCENVRVHYKQRTVYEILSLQHDDLQRGINCFQRVCPSQFPAFYRVMYVGRYPGISVSFAVCSDGEQVDLGERERRSSAGGGHGNRSAHHGRLNIRSTNKGKRKSVKQGNISKNLDNRQFVFRHIDDESKSSKIFREDKESSSSKLSRSDNYVMLNNSANRSSSRREREADTSRTIFEIPEPRPSIVYTLTGVCFCLKVQSTIQPTESDQSNTNSDRIYHFIAVKRNDSNARQNASFSLSKTESDVKMKESLFGQKNFSQFQDAEKVKTSSNRNIGTGCSYGNCAPHEMVKKRRRRSTFLDSFMKAVLESQDTAVNPSMIPTQSAILSSSSDTTSLPTQSGTSRAAWTNRTPTVAWLPKPGTNASTRGHWNRQLKHTTLKQVERNQQTAVNGSQGHRVEDDASDGDSTDEPIDPEEANDRLVVLASFSHDVHFIGSISMTVSVASSCRSNVPLSPETNSTSNETRPLTPSPLDNTTSTNVETTSSTSNSISIPMDEVPVQGMASTAPLTTTPLGDTIPKSLVEEVTENHPGNVRDDEEGDGQIDVLLVWQVSAGATFAVLMVLLLVLVTSFCRRRRRKRKKRYSSVTPESTLQRSQYPAPVNVSHTAGPNHSMVETNNNQQQSSTAVTDSPDTFNIPRTLQAISRSDPPQVFNVGTVYPMHIRLRSLSAAAEAARLRGQEALRVLNNENGNNEEEADITNASFGATRPIAPQRTGIMNTNGHRETNNSDNNSLSTESSRNSSKHLLSPTIVVSEGSNRREFDLGQFAVYRNDIMLKLRRCGLRTGRRKRKTGTGINQDYDNEENYGTGSVYSCYAGGETEI